MRMQAFGRAVSLALLLSACGDAGGGDAGETAGSTGGASQATGPAPTTSGDTDMGTGTDTETPTGEPVAGCECAEGDPCSVPLCDPIVEGGAGFDAAVSCALAALRDQKTGRLVWTNLAPGGMDSGTLDLFGDGTARQTIGVDRNMCVSVVDRVFIGELHTKNFFDACTGDPDFQISGFSCVQEPFDAQTHTCVEGETVCPGD